MWINTSVIPISHPGYVLCSVGNYHKKKLPSILRGRFDVVKFKLQYFLCFNILCNIILHCNVDLQEGRIAANWWVFVFPIYSYNHWRHRLPRLCLLGPLHKTRCWVLIGEWAPLVKYLFDTTAFLWRGDVLPNCVCVCMIVWANVWILSMTDGEEKMRWVCACVCLSLCLNEPCGPETLNATALIGGHPTVLCSTTSPVSRSHSAFRLQSFLHIWLWFWLSFQSPSYHPPDTPHTQYISALQHCVSPET